MHQNQNKSIEILWGTPYNMLKNQSNSIVNFDEFAYILQGVTLGISMDFDAFAHILRGASLWFLWTSIELHSSANISQGVLPMSCREFAYILPGVPRGFQWISVRLTAFCKASPWEFLWNAIDLHIFHKGRRLGFPWICMHFIHIAVFRSWAFNEFATICLQGLPLGFQCLWICLICIQFTRGTP